MEQSKRPEILAPAGSRDALAAAVRCGADAVYFGMGALNARRNAANFEGDAFTEAVAYCHARSVKVYLTLNTLLRDDEQESAAEAVRLAAINGVDALIVQDLAVAALAKKLCLTLPLHASTQMAIHNAAGVWEAQALGFSRIVLARELSLTEIRRIHSETDAELEVFIHGAHCMSVSGRCYLSALIGGRSGNRGLCAQPCRLDHQVNGRPYALSLKDLSYMEELPSLGEAGVCSLKIEGRMKRPEYVAAAVTAAREALDGRRPDMDALKAVFARSGFTDGYLKGKRGLAMFGRRTKEDAAESKSVLGQMAGLYRTERCAVPVTLRLRAQAAEPLELSVEDGEHTLTRFGAAPEPALHTPATKESVLRSLTKTGGTPFTVQTAKIDLDEGLALPSAALNALRRDALTDLLKLRETPKPLPLTDEPLPGSPVPYMAQAQSYRLRFYSYEQFFLPDEAAFAILPLSELVKNLNALRPFLPRLMAELPPFLSPLEEETIKRALLDAREAGLSHALSGDLGGLRLIREAGLFAHGDACLNVMNTPSLEALQARGLCDVTLSFELNKKRTAALGGSLPRGLIVYGRLPLMQLRCCPAKTAAGCGSCDGRPVVQDPTGRTFPLLCSEKKLTTLHNGVPLYLGDLPLPPVDFATLYFSTESQDRCHAVWELLKHALPFDGERTRGLYTKPDLQ